MLLNKRILLKIV